MISLILKFHFHFRFLGITGTELFTMYVNHSRKNCYELSSWLMWIENGHFSPTKICSLWCYDPDFWSKWLSLSFDTLDKHKPFVSIDAIYYSLYNTQKFDSCKEVLTIGFGYTNLVEIENFYRGYKGFELGSFCPLYWGWALHKHDIFRFLLRRTSIVNI